MIQREVPNREGLELCIARLDAAAILVVELGETGCHLAAARAGSGHNDQRSRGFDVLVSAVAVLTYNEGNVGRIAVNRVVAIHLDAHGLELCLELIRCGGIAGDDNGADVETGVPEGLNEAEHIDIVGDAEIAAYLIFFDIRRGDGDDDFRLVRELQQHAKLAVRLKARENAGSVVVVEEFAAEFQIEFVSELGNALANVLGLHLEVFFVVKTDFHIHSFARGRPALCRVTSYTHEIVS